MNPEIYLQDIIVLQHYLLCTRIRCPVSSNVVETQSSRESEASLEGIAGLNACMAR